MFNQRTFLSFLSLFFSLTLSFAQSLPCKEVIGYYPNWQWYDRGQLLKPNKLDYSKYTIINYAFFSPEANGTITSTDTWADENLLLGQPNWSQGGYYPNTSIVDLAHNAGVKILPSIGGWTLSNNFPSIAADATKRSTFANACVQLITQYNFDGIDIDWEYPGYAPHGGSAADKQNFTLLMQAIRNALTAKTTQTGKTYLLTACFGAAQSHANNIEWANVIPLLDCFNLMSYDFFGTWDATTNHNSPLYAPAQGDPNFNINSAVNLLLNTYNVPANKICVGLAFYGRSHKTPNTPSLFGAGTGTADTQTFSEDDGSPLFYNILKKQNLFNKYTDNQAVSPYLLGKNGLNTFVSYDDTASITTKATYIKNKNLRGCIIWEITGDYIETSPGSGIIAGTPLASAIKDVFCGNNNGGGGNTTCNVPNGLTANPSATYALISWAATGAATYEVQYKPNSAASWATKTTSTNAVTIDNLTASTAYQVQVRGVCSPTLSSAYSTLLSFTTTSANTGGGGNTNPCFAPATFNFTQSTYTPIGEIKIGQARLHPIWGVTVDAYIPSNRKTWAMAMAHGAHLFRNVIKTDRVSPNFYFATAAKESFCGCDNGIQAMPSGTQFPFTYQSSSLGDGCFQIEDNSAYNELKLQYPQRFPTGQHANLIGSANFETASLSKAYYDIFTVKYWEVHKNWNPIGFFNNAADPNAAVKLMAVAYNRGLWYTELGTVLNTDRSNAISSTNISPYFINNNYGYDYQNALTNYTNILGNTTSSLDPSLFATNPATGQPYNQFNSFYDPQLTWSDIDTYVEKIKVLYPTINFTTLKSNLQTVYNGINGGNSISFRYQFGQVLDALMLALPADDPSANIAATYGCGVQGTVNQSPTASITSPAANQNFIAPANITISVNASDPDGTISKVEFYSGTTLLGTKTSSPYSFAWQNVAVGNYTITAKAYDDKNAVTTSPAVAIKVNPKPNQSPIVAITQPTANQIFTAPTNVTISANASDPDGTISKVEFYNGSTLLTTKTSSPYTFTWQNVAAGIYTVVAKAYDNLGATAQTAVNVTINPNPIVPICTITTPRDGEIFQAPANITINVDAFVPNKSPIQSVSIFRNGKSLITLVKAPYTFVMTNTAVGAYQLTATALGANGQTATSNLVKITVLAPNIPPTCNLTQPAQNQTYTAPATVNIAANATDPNGTVTKVEFYNGTTLLATDNSAPYSYTWQNVAQGIYTIKAKAFDNQGATTFSTPVNITVNQPTTPLCTQYTSYVEGSPYQLNSVVSNVGGVYKCTVPAWCSGAGWAYAPGTGTSWQSAWTKTGDCTPVLPSCTTTPAYAPNTSYQAGNIVKNANKLYSCNIPAWCSGTASFYAPGTGSAWQSAWTLLGNCPSTMSNGNTTTFNQNALALVFPNPTSDDVQVIIPDAPKGWLDIQVFDMNGRLIFTKTSDNQEYEVAETLHLQHLPTGLYQLHIKTQAWQKDWLLSKM